jgi:sulfatase modifying factor 1
MKRILFLTIVVLLFWAGKKTPYATFRLKDFENAMHYIPAGSIIYSDSVELYDGVKMNYDTTKLRGASVKGFYMCDHDVTNAEYRFFLNDLRQNDGDEYKRMIPDTLVWSRNRWSMQAYTNMYFWHPAYGDYPVVGVTHEQAEYYCKWLTKHYMKEDKRKYSKVEFTLPTVYEWEQAASGGLALPLFPWKGYSLQNDKGQWQADFIPVDQSAIIGVKRTKNGKHESYTITAGDFPVGSTAPPTLDSYNCNDVHSYEATAPVKSFWPNGYGLYNMAGNVRQFVREKGITKGGGWKDMGYFLRIPVQQGYDSTNYRSNDTGFRVVMEIKS